jgi:hypothetical protein
VQTEARVGAPVLKRSDHDGEKLRQCGHHEH